MFVVKCPLLSVGTELCENLSFSAGVLVLVPFIIPFYHDLSRYVSIHVYHRRICGLYIYIYIYIYTPKLHRIVAYSCVHTWSPQSYIKT